MKILKIISKNKIKIYFLFYLTRWAPLVSPADNICCLMPKGQTRSFCPFGATTRALLLLQLLPPTPKGVATPKGVGRLRPLWAYIAFGKADHAPHRLCRTRCGTAHTAPLGAGRNICPKGIYCGKRQRGPFGPEGPLRAVVAPKGQKQCPFGHM